MAGDKQFEGERNARVDVRIYTWRAGYEAGYAAALRTIHTALHGGDQPVEQPRPEAEPDLWVTSQEAADALGVSVRTLRNWADAGRVEVVRTGGGHRRILLPQGPRS